MNALWAAHAVHHQSEDYTFAVSLRQGAIATLDQAYVFIPAAGAARHPVVVGPSFGYELSNLAYSSIFLLLLSAELAVDRH